MVNQSYSQCNKITSVILFSVLPETGVLHNTDVTGYEESRQLLVDFSFCQGSRAEEKKLSASERDFKKIRPRNKCFKKIPQNVLFSQENSVSGLILCA